MGFKLIESKRNYVLKVTQKTYVLDSEADKDNLPPCDAGSIAYVSKGGKIFMANTNGEWDSFAGAEGV